MLFFIFILYNIIILLLIIIIKQAALSRLKLPVRFPARNDSNERAGAPYLLAKPAIRL